MVLPPEVETFLNPTSVPSGTSTIVKFGGHNIDYIIALSLVGLRGAPRDGATVASTALRRPVKIKSVLCPPKSAQTQSRWPTTLVT